MLPSPTSRRARLLAALAGLAALGALQCASASAATDTTQFSVTAGTLSFGTAPDVPNLPALTLNGQLQTLNAAMNNYSVSDATGSGAGWNVTVNGDSSAGKSAVFKQYCSNGASPCGSDAANSYVSGGRTLSVGSLQLSIPELRLGSYFPPFLEPRNTAEKALVTVIQEAWIGASRPGVSASWCRRWASPASRSAAARQTFIPAT